MKRVASLGFAVAAAMFLGVDVRPGAELPQRGLPPGAMLKIGQPRIIVPGAVHDIDFSPDGNRIAVCTYDVVSDGEVGVWEIATAKRLHWQAGRKKDYLHCEFSASGKRLYTTTATWELEGNKKLGRNFDLPLLAVSPDEALVLLNNADQREISICGRVDGKQRVGIAVPGKDDRVSAAVISPDGQLTAFGTSGGHVQIHELSTAKRLHDLPDENRRGVEALAFAPDGKLLAVAGGAATISIYDVATGKIHKTLSPAKQTGPATSVAFSPDGKRLASAHERSGVYLWDIASAKQTDVIYPGIREVRALKFSPDSRILAVGGDGGSAFKLLDVATGRIYRKAAGATARITSVAFALDGSTLAMASAQDVHVWDARSGRVVELKPDADRYHDGGIREVRYSSDGWIVAAAHTTGGFRLWETNHFEPLLVSRPKPDLDRDCAAVSPIFDYVAVGMRKGKVRIIDCATSTEAYSFHVFEDVDVHELAFSSDGAYLAIAYDGRGPRPTNEPIHLWDVRNRKLQRALTVDWGEGARAAEGRPKSFRGVHATDLAFSPDGTMVAARVDILGLKVFDVKTGRPRLSVADAGKPFCFSPDSQYFVYMKEASLVMVELASGVTVFTRDIAPADADQRRRQRGNFATACGFSAGGHMLATAMSTDNTVLVWNLDPLADDVDRRRTDEHQLERSWQDLGAMDAQAAYRAMWQFVEARDVAIDFFTRQLAAGAAEKHTKNDTLRWIRVVATLERIGSEKALDALSDLVTHASDPQTTALARQAIGRLRSQGRGQRAKETQS